MSMHETIDISLKSIRSLYRTILKEGNKLPKQIQRDFIKQKARNMFRQKYESEQEIKDAYRLGISHIEDIKVQVTTFTKLYNDDRLTKEDFKRMEREEIERKTKEYQEKNHYDNENLH
ncbi:hypothetical protein ABK040_000982 [Willaertia magna]